MALGQIKVNGVPSATAVYGYQPLVVKVAKNGGFSATQGGAGVPIVEGGYAQAVRTVEQFASIIILGAQSNDSFAVVVDGASANIDALTAAFEAMGGTVATATVLGGNGAFTFA